VRSSYADLDPEDRERARLLRDTGDREAHDLIASRLAAARPDDVVLSEEGVDDAARLTADRLWIVDPLDGTWEYGQGRADFAVHIALWTRTETGGELSAGTVDLPAQGVTWSELDAPPEPPAAPRDRAVRIVVSRSRRPARLDDTVARLATRLAELGITGRGVEVVQVGSVGAKAAELFAGRAEIYLHDSGFSDWDLAAPLAVASHRGFWSSAPDGGPFVFNRMPPLQPGVVMAAPSVAAAVRDVLHLP
jgi:3'(2'), 5'-bisphosphate nucleotidase